MKTFIPRKWAAKRKLGKRPRFFMRRDQAQHKERVRSRRHRQQQRSRRERTTLDNAAEALPMQIHPHIEG